MNHVNSDNICPVCGYDRLEDGTASGEICSSCGTEFGYSDFQRTPEELRQRWISNTHAQWWSRYTPRPLGWTAVNQLRNIGYECTLADLQKINPDAAIWAAANFFVKTGDVIAVFTVIQSPPFNITVRKVLVESENYHIEPLGFSSGIIQYA